MSGLMDVFDADDSAAGHDARSMHFLKVAQNPRPRRTSFSLADPETMVAASKPRCLLRRTIPRAGLCTLSLEFGDRHFDVLLALGVRKDNLGQHALAGRMNLNRTIAVRPDPVDPQSFPAASHPNGDLVRTWASAARRAAGAR